MFKVGIVGCGRIASTFDKGPNKGQILTHIGAYKVINNIEIIAVCDINKDSLKKCMQKWKINKGYSNLLQMLNREKIDILSICTPPSSHYSILKKAADFPLTAIFCEKPIANNVKEAKEMVGLCQKKKILLQIDHQRRFDPLHINLKKMIVEKKLGSVQQVNFYYTAGIKNTGSHMFDLLRFLFGEVKWLEAFFSKNKSKNENDPNLDGVMCFNNGLLATFQACDVKKYLIFELNCFLDKGRFVLKNSGFSLDFYKIDKSGHFSGYKELEKTASPFKTKYKRNFMVNAVDHLVKCIKNKSDSVSSGSEGLKALELIEASIFSAKKNSKRIYLK